jgi:hypothetical protein
MCISHRPPERRVRRLSRLGAVSSTWEWEIGEPVVQFNPDRDFIAMNKSVNVRASYGRM